MLFLPVIDRCAANGPGRPTGGERILAVASLAELLGGADSNKAGDALVVVASSVNRATLCSVGGLGGALFTKRHWSCQAEEGFLDGGCATHAGHDQGGLLRDRHRLRRLWRSLQQTRGTTDPPRPAGSMTDCSALRRGAQPHGTMCRALISAGSPDPGIPPGDCPADPGPSGGHHPGRDRLGEVDSVAKDLP